MHRSAGGLARGRVRGGEAPRTGLGVDAEAPLVAASIVLFAVEGPTKPASAVGGGTAPLAEQLCMYDALQPNGNGSGGGIF